MPSSRPLVIWLVNQRRTPAAWSVSVWAIFITGFRPVLLAKFAPILQESGGGSRVRLFVEVLEAEPHLVGRGGVEVQALGHPQALSLVGSQVLGVPLPEPPRLLQLGTVLGFRPPHLIHIYRVRLEGRVEPCVRRMAARLQF